MRRRAEVRRPEGHGALRADAPARGDRDHARLRAAHARAVQGPDPILGRVLPGVVLCEWCSRALQVVWGMLQETASKTPS